MQGPLPEDPFAQNRATQALGGEESSCRLQLSTMEGTPVGLNALSAADHAAGGGVAEASADLRLGAEPVMSANAS